MKREKWWKYADAEVLSRVEVREVAPNFVKKWNLLMKEKHYLHSAALVGRQLRHVVTLDGKWIGLIGWSDATYHLRGREEWIGWAQDIEKQKQRRKFVVQNCRFLLLVARGEYPNLASRALSLSCDQMKQDWQRIYGYLPLVAESFVDPELFKGSCYRAAGWEALGKTKGFSRGGTDFYQEDGRPKELWVRQLHPQARKWLSSDKMPERYAEHEDKVYHCRYTSKESRSLFQHFQKLEDKRTRKGRQHCMASVMTICTLGTLCGCRGTGAIADFAANLTQAQLKMLKCYRDKKTGKYVSPSQTTIRRLLRAVAAADFDKAVIAWQEEIDPTVLKRIAVDGKTVKKALQKDGRQLHLVSAISHDTNRLVAQRPVDEKSNEITALRPMLQDVPLDNVVVTADAMQAQQMAARFIVQEKGGDYLFSLKGNQPSIQEKSAALLNSAFPPSISSTVGNDRKGTWPY